MNFRQIALEEAYSRLRAACPDPELLGEEYKANGKPFTDAELAKFLKAWDKEIERLGKRLPDVHLGVD
jgi:hypothetical protein